MQEAKRRRQVRSEDIRERWRNGRRVMPARRKNLGRHLFFGTNRHALDAAMRRACKAAEIADYSPHDLRHRYISLKIKQGVVPITDVAAQSGHAKKSLTLDTYAHVLIDE